MVAVAADRILAPRHMKRPQVTQKPQPPGDIESNKEVNFMASTVSRLKSALRGTHGRKKQVQFVIPKSTSENLDPPNSDEKMQNTSWLKDIENSRANDLKKKLERLQQTRVEESSSESEKPIPGPQRQPPSPPIYISPSIRTRARPGILRSESRTYTNQQTGRRRTSKKVDIDTQKIRQDREEERIRQAAIYQENVGGGPTIPLTADVLRKQQRRNQPPHLRDSTDSEQERNRSVAEGFSRRTQASTTYSHGASERGHVPRAFVRETTDAAHVSDENYEQRRRSAVRSFDEDYRPVPMYPNRLSSRRPSSYNTREPLVREEGRQEPEVTIRIPGDPLPRALPETEATFIVDEQGVVRISPRHRVYHKPYDPGPAYGVNAWDAESDEAFLQRNKHKLLPSSQPSSQPGRRRSTHLASLTEEVSNSGNPTSYV
jgi:hypothetical protein